ncbi:RdgB/HAM1 family non-canonical purine NTP pyrophosphatase [Natronospirillum operosum]|uniref:dITP/XTP pyrophosphatase n=1 Tax=Natronospirillum operosum TaxID=2759953 RepID=A0A4Z0W5U8_9GAMM|nr:RdgB/HAM1 family non-canonical purine NTP pyrophosphatase [Natronospirillum operosum]TGG90066.1 RdgB/HAM1 family non-canonical purine NTP pyrophosphatase [Natronospirillum operosum]
MSILVLASGNAGKLREFSGLLGDLGIEVRPQGDFNVPDAAETGLTFVENALIKARAAARHTGHAAMADDSGLEVDALKGAPGIYSARYAGTHGDDAANNRKLLAALEGVPKAERTARFVCALAVLRHAEDPRPLICQAVWEGRILEAPAGAGGFGYDPLFHVPDQGCSAAELPADTKNRLSHRARASQELRRALPDWWR